MSASPNTSFENTTHEVFIQQLEAMMRVQIGRHPGDTGLRLRLARLYADQGQREAFVPVAQDLQKRLALQPDESNSRELKQLARKLRAEAALHGGEVEHGQRRHGEDPATTNYFARLQQRFEQAIEDGQLQQAHDRGLNSNLGAGPRPSPLYFAQNYSRHYGGAKIAIKREDLMGRGSRLQMAVHGQVLLAQRLGCKTVVTGSQSIRTGVLMASIAKRLGLRSTVFIDHRAVEKNSSEITHLRCLGARLISVPSNESTQAAAIKDCMASEKDRFAVVGVDGAPDPYPQINQLFLGSLGRETADQCHQQFGARPDLLVCRGRSTADAVGFFDPFLEDNFTRLVCVDQTGNIESLFSHALPRAQSTQQLSEQQLQAVEAILEGSEYPSVKREHAAYDASGRVEYVRGELASVRQTLKDLLQHEGLLFPVRTALALAWASTQARKMDPQQLVVVNLVEPYDKDLRDIEKMLNIHD